MEFVVSVYGCQRHGEEGASQANGDPEDSPDYNMQAQHSNG